MLLNETWELPQLTYFRIFVFQRNSTSMQLNEEASVDF
jgi:hypothetical protein